MNLSDAIRIRRKELGLTLRELADKIGVAEATVQRYESGNIKNVRHERIVKIADALELEPAELMGWEKKQKPAPKKEDELTEKQKVLIDKVKNLDPQQLDAFDKMLDAFLASRGK